MRCAAFQVRDANENARLHHRGGGQHADRRHLPVLERDTHLYVGRTKRLIRTRLKNHVSTAKDCPFAFRLARQATGRTEARYSGDHTRRRLLEAADFQNAYHAAKNRIREMEVRWVEEADPVRQALLEVYVSVILETPFNDFNTH